MARPCILHSRVYRAVYEGLANSLSSVLSFHTLSSMRNLQCGHLCTCAGPLAESSETPAAGSSPAELTASSNNIQEVDGSCNAFEMSNAAARPAADWIQVSRRSGTGSLTGGAAGHAFAAVRETQAQLQRLAEKRGQLAEVAAAISRLTPLLEAAIAVPPPPETKTPKDGAVGGPLIGRARRQGAGRLAHRLQGRRRYAALVRQTPPPPPSRPYAPLRWPPLAVTMGVLRGRLAPAPPAQPQKDTDEAPYLPYYDEDVLDIAEEFETKLELGRGSRRGRGSGNGGGLADPKYGPTGLRGGRWASGAEVTQLLQKRAQLQERKERKAVMAHAEARKDNHRCFRGSKNAAGVADLWPYK